MDTKLQESRKRQKTALDDITGHLRKASCHVVTLLAQTANPRHPSPDIEAEALGELAQELVRISHAVQSLRAELGGAS